MRALLRLGILFLVRLFGMPRAARAARKAQKSLQVRSPRILLIRPDHLGDMLLTTPVLTALKEQAPDASITMMVGPWSSEVVARHPALDTLLTCRFPGFQRADRHPLEPYALLLQTARQLRQGNYDLAINLRPDFWWGATLLYLAGIPHRVGYHIKPALPFLTQTLLFPPHEHATISNLRLSSAGLQAIGYPALVEPFTPASYPLVFTPTEDERTWARQRLVEAGIEQTTPLVVIHPGTGGAVKLWRSQAWSQVANTLISIQELTQTPRIILTGSPHERSLLEEIAQGINNVPVCFSDQTVGQLAALLECAQLVLGVDNGPLHLAVAQRRPTLRLFGPTDARIFGPWGDPQWHITIASTRRCPTCPTIPCGRLDFTPAELPRHPCVKHISEQEVVEAINRLLPLSGSGVKT